MKTRTKERAKREPRVYTAETNRAMRDSIRWVVRFLERHGIKVTRIAHLTSVLLERPPQMSWAQFTAILRAVPQPRIGSVLVTSCTTGRVFLCSNRGNQPGVFQRLA
jgi:hypothetical protein